MDKRYIHYNSDKFDKERLKRALTHENNNVARKAWNDMIKEKKQWHRKLM